jgi:hypothetical protein
MSDQAGNPARARVDGQDARPVMQEIGAHHFPDTSRVDEKQIAHRLAMAFSTFMVGVTLPSENDYPYETFWVELHPQVRLTRKVFCELLGLEPSLDMVWTHPSPRQAPDDPSNEAQLENALRNILLLTMRSLLGEVTEVLARGENVVQVPYFLFGRLKTGALVGVRSISIET